MTLFTFDDTIPAAPNNPSNDQPIMLSNNVANQAIWDVDHVGFNANNGGQHLQVTFQATGGYVTPPGAQTGNNSVAYTKAGTASTAAQLMFVNSNVTTQLSAIRAWATCDSTGAFLGSQQVNVSGVVHNSTGIYTVTLTANAVSSNQFAVLIAASSSGAPGMKYGITGVGTFQLQFFTTLTGTLTDPTTFSFQVLQI